jgi:hypothetical protein
MIPTCIYIIYPWVLLVQDRVVALLRFDGRVGNLSLLTIGDYYDHKSHNKMVERKWWPGRDVVWVLVGVIGGVPRPRGIAWLHYFPCPCQLRTVCCIDPGHVTDLLSRAHTCLWERGRACHSFVMGSGSFWTDWLEAGIGGGLSMTLRTGLKCGGLESNFGRGPRTHDRSGTGWSRLCLGCKRGVYFWGTQLGTLICESPFWHDGTAWLRSGTVVRTVSWKMEKWFWLLNPCLL